MHTISRRGAAGRPPLRTPLSQSRPPGLRRRGAFHDALARLADVVLSWQDRAAQRAALARMDARILKDIGVTRSEALREARRPFWQA